MFELIPHDCACGHESALHDTYGCAAFLGAFPSTAHVKRYCSCRRAAAKQRTSIHEAALRPQVVAEIRLCERRGSAIGVCEFPPALELGASADGVLAAMKTRLLDVIAPPHDGVKQALRVQYDGNVGLHVRVEQLR